MKTTLDIQDDLLAEAKAQAAHERRSLTALIEEGLRLRLRKPQPRGRAANKSPSLPIYRGKGGLLRGIDPTSNRSLLDAADDDT